jgi:NAD-specific glutamate dehydrogenase
MDNIEGQIAPAENAPTESVTTQDTIALSTQDVAALATTQISALNTIVDPVRPIEAAPESTTIVTPVDHTTVVQPDMPAIADTIQSEFTGVTNEAHSIISELETFSEHIASNAVEDFKTLIAKFKSIF